ncbi:sensor histidine kinase [Geodermatophilus sp. SYSU D01186]
MLSRFVAGNVVAASLLLAASVWASHAAARSEALADARSRTDLVAELLVEPNLGGGLLTGDPQAIADLDAVVETQLRDAAVVRLKIWDDDQRIVYSDETQLVGRTFPESEYSVRSFVDGDMSAEVSDLGRAENEFERSRERLLEVYRPVIAQSGERLLLEAYFDYDRVTNRQVAIWLEFAPISAAALVCLLLFQLPMARRMIRDVRAADQERLRLQAQAADATVEERRRIAGGLHDGVVQDLSAAPLIMSRAIDHLRTRAPGGTHDHSVADDLQLATAAVRQSVASLRSLLIEIYPPHLARAGLPAALGDLAARTQSRGVHTRLELPDDLDLPPESAALLFRTAQEALTNVVKHARARRAVLTVTEDESSVTLVIRDDGIGFDLTESSESPPGHFGLRLMHDLAQASGATLDLATAPGRGTALRLRQPHPRRPPSGRDDERTPRP